MVSNRRSRTVNGSPVSTSAHFPGNAVVTLRMIDAGAPLDLAPALVVELFALGLRSPEPDRAGWVPIAELDVDDDVTFTVGVTTVDSDLALEAVRRGVELALVAGLARAVEVKDDPPQEETHDAVPER